MVDAASKAPIVGTVSLVAAPLELQSVAVTETRPDIQLAPDRNTYVVRDMPAAKGGSALDVLRTVPAVDVDIDNVVSLRGNSGVTIQINGRPSPLKPAQLGDYLAQLPADMVDKVEIVPNPSARDDPTGVTAASAARRSFARTTTPRRSPSSTSPRPACRRDRSTRSRAARRTSSRRTTMSRSTSWPARGTMTSPVSEAARGAPAVADGLRNAEQKRERRPAVLPDADP